MKILGCAAVPLVCIQMTVGDIGIPEKGGIVPLLEKPEEGKLRLYIPKKLAKELFPGSVIEALCVPTPDLSMGYQTFVLAKKDGGITRVIYSAGNYWAEQFRSLVF